MSTVIEITIDDLLNDYNWAEVFGDESSGNTDKQTDAAPPGARIDTTPPTRGDVVEIIAAANGENDGPEWIGLFRLRDGRYLVASGSCDYTGWDCQAGNSLVVSATLDDALRYGMTPDERTRLRLPDPVAAPSDGRACG